MELSIIKELTEDEKPFFEDEGVVFELIKKHESILHNSYNGTKFDIIAGVFQTLEVDEFILMKGHSIANVGKVALIFCKDLLTEEEVKDFNDMIFHTLPLTVYLRCFVFDSDFFNKVKESCSEQRLIE